MQYKTWVSINRKAITHNAKVLRSHIQKKTQLWAVIKSNAYGHGLWHMAEALDEIGVDPVRGRARAKGTSPQDRGAATSNGVDGYCVDSVIEGAKLRLGGISKPILVLGPTFPNLLADAAAHNITLSISTMEALQELTKTIKDPAVRPSFHLKVDTGMNRQGFYLKDLPRTLAYIKKHKLPITGIFSHFAAAKDINYPTFSEQPNKQFLSAIALAKRAGFTNLTKHLAATAGTILSSKYHYDAVRCGIGLYGIYPSNELEAQLKREFPFQPALSWYARISEVKHAPAGDFIGYDFTERLAKKTQIAIVPIGYWHGLSWSLSGQGTVLAGGKRCKILGRVSMDLIAIDTTGSKTKVGDPVVLIGTQGKETITARELARLTNTTPYEIVTRINPLIHRTIS